MNTHLYHIVDFEGFTLCEIISRPTNSNFDDYAKSFIIDLLPVIAKQYGIKKAFYDGGE
tara:strand:+ start:1319 stop:1495 length:177 start_codon:yes stop_codon:yes gene_type:complete